MKLERIIAIDDARVIATFFIIISHVISQGIGITNFSENTINYSVLSLLKCLTFPALNVYLLISGYVGVKSNHSKQRLISLWFEVFFYSLGFTIITCLIGTEVSKKDYILSILPVLSKRYWYFSSYFFAFFIFPYINYVLLKCEKKSNTKLLFYLFGLTSILGTISRVFGDPFGIIGGYSPLWMMVMYYCGGYLRVYKEGYFYKLVNKWKWIMYFFGSFISFGSIYAIRFVDKGMGLGINEYTLLSYISPFAVISSISLLMIFLNIEKNTFWEAISKISKFTFGVYLVHVHPIIWSKYLHQSFSFVMQLNPIEAIIIVIFSSISIFAVAVVVEIVREKIFSIFHLDDVSKKLCCILNGIIVSVVNAP